MRQAVGGQAGGVDRVTLEGQGRKLTILYLYYTLSHVYIFFRDIHMQKLLQRLANTQSSG